MYYVMRDVLRHDLVLGNKVVVVIRHLVHVLTLEALFLLRFSLDNIPRYCYMVAATPS